MTLPSLSMVFTGRVSGLPFLIAAVTAAGWNRLRDSVATVLCRGALFSFGSSSVIQHGTVIRYPGNVSIGRAVNIGRNCEITSELPNGTLHIGDGAQINTGAHIDFTGGLTIAERVVISSEAMIYTHSHGYDPHSQPIGSAKRIDEGAWIGARSTILESVAVIGSHAVIAAGSVVTRDVPPAAVMAGVPARQIGRREVTVDQG